MKEEELPLVTGSPDVRMLHHSILTVSVTCLHFQVKIC